MYKEVIPIIDKKIRGMCKLPYHNHPKGCPNWNKREDCPPIIPKLDDFYDMSKPIFFIWHKFDFDAHLKMMKDRHPDWTDPQLRNVRYWQEIARMHLRAEVKKFKEQYPEYTISFGPEAMGINVTETMKNIGIQLEWPPMNYVYKIAIAGVKKESRIQTFEQFIFNFKKNE